MSDAMELRNRSKMAVRTRIKRNTNSEKGVDSSGTETCECGICDALVTDDDEAIACEICDWWLHIKCEELPKCVYDFMGIEEGSKKLLWHCKYCSGGSAKLFHRLQKLEIDHDETREIQNRMVNEIKEVKEDMDKKKKEFNARQNALEGEMEVVKSALDEEGKYPKVIKYRVDQVETKYADLRKEFDLIKDRNVEVSSDEVKKDLEKDLLEKATNHIQSRMDRKNNIIVHGAPEEVKGELALWVKSEKIKHDKAIILELCLDIDVGCYADDIVDIKRIGKFKRNQGQINEEVTPRPIIVTLKEGIKEKIVRNVYKLKNTKNEMLKRIRVSHDMTREERKYDMELRMEAKKRNEEEVDQNFIYVVRESMGEIHIKIEEKGDTGGIGCTPNSGGGGSLAGLPNITVHSVNKFCVVFSNVDVFSPDKIREVRQAPR